MNRERVKDYPRPPRVDQATRRVRIEFGDSIIVDTDQAVRVLEKTHPPGYYIPRDAVIPEVLRAAEWTTFCEWKGTATYFDLVAGEREEVKAAWTYENPLPGFESIAGYVSFYPGRVDACWLDDERVEAEPSKYYGGWITADIEL